MNLLIFPFFGLKYTGPPIYTSVRPNAPLGLLSRRHDLPLPWFWNAQGFTIGTFQYGGGDCPTRNKMRINTPVKGGRGCRRHEICFHIFWKLDPSTNHLLVEFRPLLKHSFQIFSNFCTFVLKIVNFCYKILVHYTNYASVVSHVPVWYHECQKNLMGGGGGKLALGNFLPSL